MLQLMQNKHTENTATRYTQNAGLPHEYILFTFPDSVSAVFISFFYPLLPLDQFYFLIFLLF